MTKYQPKWLLLDKPTPREQPDKPDSADKRSSREQFVSLVGSVGLKEGVPLVVEDRSLLSLQACWARHGIELVLMSSNIVGESAGIIREEGLRDLIGARYPDLVLYSLAELELIVSNRWSAAQLRHMHSAKKMLGGNFY